MKKARLLSLVLPAVIAACASTEEQKSADQGTQSPAAATTPKTRNAAPQPATNPRGR